MSSPDKRPTSLAPISVFNPSKQPAKESALINSVQTPHEQLELFLWKFKDVQREDITAKLEEFLRFDKGKKGELEENEAMMLLEARGETKTFRELRQMVADMDIDNNHRLSFLEYSCAMYNKDYSSLDDFVDEEARQKALAQVKAANEAREKVAAEIIAAKLREEEAARLKAEELERESKLTGVAGKAAFFKRQAENVGADTTKTNEQKIKEEAARRKALREAAAAEKAAQEIASQKKSPEDLAREIAEAKLKNDQKVAEEKAAKEAEEKKARAIRKASINAAFGSKTALAAAATAGAASSPTSPFGSPTSPK